MTTPAASLAAEVAALPWYHTLELPGGIVTPGEYDLRPAVRHLPLPDDLRGRRCLDIGTHDGFWAFELERRGAEVVAIDLDDPSRLDWPQPAPVLGPDISSYLARRRAAFPLAHRALGSTVQRRDLSVYDLDPADVGTFDLAIIGTLLHHLRDPVAALTAARRVVRGSLVLSAAFSVSETALHPWRPRAEMVVNREPFWEVPNLRGLAWQLDRSGWLVQQRGRPYLQRYGAGWRQPPVQLGRPGSLPRQLLLRRGAPHVSFLAVPAVP